jgi:sporulation protein YlmC with PRC-barrel domain
MTDSKFNEGGEVVNSSGKEVGKVGDKAKEDSSSVSGFDVVQSAKGTEIKTSAGNGGGIEITMQTTKEGTTLTIRIPGVFQQQ